MTTKFKRLAEMLLAMGMGPLAACSSNTEQATPLACSGCNVTGTWYGEYSVASNRNIFQVNAVQTGSDLTGTMTASLFSASTPPAITGKQQNGKIEFGDIEGQIHFAGTTDGEVARGTYEYPSQRYSGNWEAEHIKAGTITKTNCIQFDVDGGRPGGLTHDGVAFWYISLGDDVIRRIDSTGAVLKSFPRPGNTVGGDPKFAFDGTNLWMSDLSSLTVISTNGQQVSSVDVTFGPDFAPANGITAMGGAIWTTGMDSRLRRINDQAKSLETKSLPVNMAGAAVYDGNYLWVAEGFTGANNVTHLYQLDSRIRVTAVYTLTEASSLGSMVQVSDLAYDGRALWASFQDLDEICMLQLNEG